MITPEATPTSASVADYRELYGKPTIVFGLPNGRSYHWYGSPYVVMNEYDDGSRTAYEKDPPVVECAMSRMFK